MAYLPENFYSVDLLVVPLWGLYANMIAQLLSQVSSHFMIHYHRQVVHRATVAFFNTGNSSLKSEETKQVTAEENGNGGPKENGLPAPLNNDGDADGKGVINDGDDTGPGSIVCVANQWVVLSDGSSSTPLHEHQFSAPQLGGSEHVVVRARVNGFLSILVVCVAILVIVGCIVRSFSLEILGIVGIAIEFGQDFDQATTYHSVLSVIKMLLEQASFLDIGRYYVGLGTLYLLVLVTVMIVPILQSIALLYQWLRPMSLVNRTRLLIAIETLQAWQYSEVYLLSIFVAR